MMASNEKDFSFEGRIRPTVGCKQKYYKEKYINGVIISCGKGNSVSIEPQKNFVQSV